MICDFPIQMHGWIAAAFMYCQGFGNRTRNSVVMVTHNLHQAGRVSDYTAFMYLGDLIEFGATEQIFTTPQDRRTENYITGRFG